MNTRRPPCSCSGVNRRRRGHRPALWPRKAHLVPLPVPGFGRICGTSGKIAPLHYKVDREAWDRHTSDFEPVNCAPLGRATHEQRLGMPRLRPLRRPARRGLAVTPLTLAEVLDLSAPAKTADAVTLLFGVLASPPLPFNGPSAPGS